MNLSTFILLFVFSIDISLLFFILAQKNKQRFTYVFLLVLLITIWQGIELYTLLFLLDNNEDLLTAVRLGLLPALFFAPSFIRLAYGMFNKWDDFSRWIKISWFLPAILMSPFVFTAYNVSEVIVEDNRAFYIPGGLYWFFAFYFATLMIFGLYILKTNRKNSNQIVQRQVDYIFIATALTAILGIFVGVLLPLFGFIGTYYMVVNATVFFTVIITYALFRYRFFGIRASFYQVFFDLSRLFLTAIVFYGLYSLMKDSTIVDFDNFVNVLYLFLFISLSSPLVFNLMDKLVLFLVSNPSAEIAMAEQNIAESLKSQTDMNVSLSKLAHNIGRVIDYNELYIYFTKLDDQSVFKQVFPVGERIIDRKTDIITKYLEGTKGMLNVAEVFYFNQEKELMKELAQTTTDIILPIYYNEKLVGLVFIDNNHKLLSTQQLRFLQQVNNYLDISIGSFLLYQQALIKKI